MTPAGEPGVSDFGISPSGPPAARAEHVPGEDPRVALCAALRRVTTAVVAATVPDDALYGATGVLEEVAETLEGRAGPSRRARAQPDPLGPPQDFFPTSPAIGFANPISPPIVVEAGDGTLVGHATFDYQYEGPPGCVHGGVIALVFDEMLGAATIAAGNPGMTGTLTIRYRRPTPLRTPLRLEAAFVERQGRKITARGAIYDGDELTAEAEGIFIELVPERFMKVIAEHAAPDAAEFLAQVRADVERASIVARTDREDEPPETPPA